MKCLWRVRSRSQKKPSDCNLHRRSTEAPLPGDRLLSICSACHSVNGARQTLSIYSGVALIRLDGVGRPKKPKPTKQKPRNQARSISYPTLILVNLEFKPPTAEKFFFYSGHKFGMTQPPVLGKGKSSQRNRTELRAGTGPGRDSLRLSAARTEPRLSGSLTAAAGGQPVPERRRRPLRLSHTGQRGNTKEQAKHAKQSLSVMLQARG